MDAAQEVSAFLTLRRRFGELRRNLLLLAGCGAAGGLRLAASLSFSYSHRAPVSRPLALPHL